MLPRDLIHVVVSYIPLDVMNEKEVEKFSKEEPRLLQLVAKEIFESVKSPEDIFDKVIPSLGEAMNLMPLLRGGNINGGFMFAARNGYFHITKYFLNRSADIHASDDYALRSAATNGHLEVVRLLLDRGADLMHEMMML